MPGYHNNLLSYCLDGAKAVFVLMFGLICSLWLGCVLGLLIVHQEFIDVPMAYWFLWFVVALAGLIQLWGFLSYLIIGFEVIALFRVDSHRWLVLLTILLIQTCEMIRSLLDYDDFSPWLQALAILGILLFPAIHFLLHHYLEDRPGKQEASYTDCRSCGYNLTGSLAARGTSCPECGEPVSQYQHVRSIAEQRSMGTGPR